MHIDILVFLRPVEVAICYHLHPALGNVVSLRHDMLNGPDILIALCLLPEILFIFTCHAALFQHAQNETRRVNIFLIDIAIQFLPENLVWRRFFP